MVDSQYERRLEEMIRRTAETIRNSEQTLRATKALIRQSEEICDTAELLNGELYTGLHE